MQSERDASVIQVFKKRRRRQMIAIIPALGALLLVALVKQDGIFGFPENVISICGVTVIFGVVAFSYLNWRCPACGTYLGKGINPQFCPRCGGQLQERS